MASESRPPLHATAYFLGDRIDTRSLEAAEKLATFPLLVRAGERGRAAIFRYGAVVLFDLTPIEQASFLRHLQPFVHGAKPKPDTEEVTIRFEPNADSERAENGLVTLRDDSFERLLTVADILGKSVILAHYESSIAQIFDTIEPLAERLRAGERAEQHGKHLLSHIGNALHIQTRMVGRAEIEDKPEFLWNVPEVERLYVRMEDEYELVERHRVLNRKIDLVSRAAETLLQLNHSDRALRVEYYIVILILFEIAITLVDMIVLRR
jgi:uncharacterized Rmd1/YagE family protein